MDKIKLMQESIDVFLTPEGQVRASSGFRALALGRPPTPRTPLFKDQDPDEILSNWLDVLDLVYDGNPDLRPLIDYDKSRKTKFGPQGGLRPFDEREEDFDAYYTTPDRRDSSARNKIVEWLDNSGILGHASAICFGTANELNKRPLQLETVVKMDQLDDKLNSNSGCRDYASRTDPAVQANAIEAVKDGTWVNLPMILGSRSQRGSERFIFMAPFSLNIVEKTYLYPLMQQIRENGDPFFSAWEGFSEVERGFKNQNFFSEEYTYIQQDFTKMDKHFNLLQMSIVFSVCWNVFQSEPRKSFKSLLRHILEIPVLVSLDKAATGLHGMPSGSGMTNFAESIVSLVIILTYRASGLDVVACQGLGDDSVMAIRRGKFLDEEILELMESTADLFGQTVNPEKQGISEHTTVYLQRFFDDRIPNHGIVLGMYPSILALNTAIFPERYHDPRKWSKEMEILRWIMILENCKNLPYFYKLVLFFMEGDKYQLGLALPDFFVMLPDLYEESKAIKGFVPTYNQESMDRGIYDFTTVKLLLEIASMRK